jgi:predicted amidophosphoribosyltransferase
VALTNDFLKKYFTTHYCDGCNRHFPASVLIQVESDFKEIAGKYCTVCYHKIYDLIGYCDECGNEYPKQYLYKSEFDQGVICKECLKNE